MHRGRFRSVFSGLLIAVLAAFVFPATPLYAAPGQDDEVVVGSDLILQRGEHIDGDLVMMGGNLEMRQGSRVRGSITVFGGRVELGGAVDGDVVAFGGQVRLETHARVQGEVVALGGQVHRAEGARAGGIVEGAPSIDLWRDLRWPLFSVGRASRPSSVLWTLVATSLGALVLALLGMAVAAFWPTQTAQVGRTILVAPLPSLGVGCLLYPLAASLIFFILITICLTPFIPVVVLVLLMANLLGWVALGALFGRWLVNLVPVRRAEPAIVAGMGTFVVSVVAAVLGALPVVGPLLVLGAAGVGLGAVALSRFGTNSYRRREKAGSPAEV